MERNVILFDWDGTLADNFAVIKDGINHVYDHFGMPKWSDDEAKKNIRLTAKDLYGKLFNDPMDVQKALDIYLSYVENNHLDSVKPIQGAEDCLRALCAEGYVLGIVSNKTQRFLDKEVIQLGWADFFDIIIGAGTAKNDKPHPDSIMLALDMLKSKEHHAYYVGDTETDMLAARRAKVKPIFVTYGLGSESDLSKTVFTDDFPVICNDYSELTETLSSQKI